MTQSTRFRKKYYLFEIPLFYLFLHALNGILAPDHPAYTGLDPHPYWLGVLLFALRYGVVPGLFAGFCSACLYLGINWFQGENYRFEDVSFYTLPTLFMIVGALIGLGFKKTKIKMSGMLQEKQNVQNDLAKANQEINVLKELNLELEKKIVTRSMTLATVYQGVNALESSDVEIVYKAMVNFTSKALDVPEVALYLKKEGGWELKESRGWKDYYKRKNFIPDGEGLIGMAALKKKIVSLRDFVSDPHQAPQLMGDALLAGPVVISSSQEVRGILSIQNMAFTQLNSATVNLFALLLNWYSRSLEKTLALEHLKGNEVVDSNLKTHTQSYFENRFKQEIGRAHKTGFPLALGTLAFTQPPSRADLLASVEVLRGILPDLALISFYADFKSLVFLYFPENEAEILELKSKLEKVFEKLMVKELRPVVALSLLKGNFQNPLQAIEVVLGGARAHV